jgi:hypothetical protein
MRPLKFGERDECLFTYFHSCPVSRDVIIWKNSDTFLKKVVGLLELRMHWS